MTRTLEQQVEDLVGQLEARRKKGLPTVDIQMRLQEIRAQQGGPRKITGEAHITMPLPKSKPR